MICDYIIPINEIALNQKIMTKFDTENFEKIDTNLNNLIEISEDIYYCLFLETKNLFQNLNEEEKFSLMMETSLKGGVYSMKLNFLKKISKNIFKISENNVLEKENLLNKHKNDRTFNLDIIDYMNKLETRKAFFYNNTTSFHKLFSYLYSIDVKNENEWDTVANSLNLNVNLLKEIEKEYLSSIEKGIKTDYFEIFDSCNAQKDTYRYSKKILFLNVCSILLYDIAYKEMKFRADYGGRYIEFLILTGDKKTNKVLQQFLTLYNMTSYEKVYCIEEEKDRETYVMDTEFEYPTLIMKDIIKKLAKPLFIGLENKRGEFETVLETMIDMFFVEIEKKQINDNFEDIDQEKDKGKGKSDYIKRL